MKDYEELYASLQPVQKDLKDAASAVTRLQKAASRAVESGNLAELGKTLDQLKEALETASETAGAFTDLVGAFDTSAYFSDGDFARQLLAFCEEKGIDVRGEEGVYEMFPYKVRITGDADHPEEVYLNRKKIPSFRPSYVAEQIRIGREKLYKAPFKAPAFMEELAGAYEVTCLKSGARIGSTQSLTKIYKNLVPMARARKDYDMQAFSFDLAQLFECGAEAWVTRDGRGFYFGTSRDGKSGIRVVSSTGLESYISTLRQMNRDDA